MLRSLLFSIRRARTQMTSSSERMTFALSTSGERLSLWAATQSIDGTVTGTCAWSGPSGKSRSGPTGRTVERTKWLRNSTRRRCRHPWTHMERPIGRCRYRDSPNFGSAICKRKTTRRLVKGALSPGLEKSRTARNGDARRRAGLKSRTDSSNTSTRSFLRGGNGLRSA